MSLFRHVEDHVYALREGAPVWFEGGFAVGRLIRACFYAYAAWMLSEHWWVCAFFLVRALASVDSAAETARYAFDLYTGVESGLD